MMKRASTALAVLLLAAACASTPFTSSGEGTGGSSAGSLPTLRNAPDYILLSAPNQIRTWRYGTGVEVRGLYVRGLSTPSGFLPAGDIQGNGRFCADAQEWLSLRDLTVYKTSQKVPQAPYILGCSSGGVFQPASREIVAQ